MKIMLPLMAFVLASALHAFDEGPPLESEWSSVITIPGHSITYTEQLVTQGGQTISRGNGGIGNPGGSGGLGGSGGNDGADGTPGGGA